MAKAIAEAAQVSGPMGRSPPGGVVRIMIRVLLIEGGRAAASEVVASLLGAERTAFAVTLEPTAAEATLRLERETFDVVLTSLDAAGGVHLPALSKARNTAPLLPVVILCREDQRNDAQRALRGGADDFVCESERNTELLARVLLHAIERRRSDALVTFLTRHDAQTGLDNRIAFLDRVSRALARVERRRTAGAILLVDCDLPGQAEGTAQTPVTADSIRRQIADRLRTLVRPYDALARLETDEFAVLLEEIREGRDAGHLAERIRSALHEPLVGGLRPEPRLGAVLFPFDGQDAPTLVRKARLALDRDRPGTPATSIFFDETTGRRIREQLEMERDLEGALDRGEFSLTWEPQTRLDGIGFPDLALRLRWDHPDRGSLSLETFGHVAGKSGHMPRIGLWALRAAAAQVRDWNGLDFGRIAIGLSRPELESAEIVDRIVEILSAERLDPGRLEVEIPQEIFENPVLAERVSSLQKRGIRICLEDFGLDPCPIDRLAGLPVDDVRIRPALLSGGSDSPSTTLAVSALVAFLRQLGFSVSGSGITSEAEARALREHGCERINGPLVGGALYSDAIERWVETRRAPRRPLPIPPGDRVLH